MPGVRVKPLEGACVPAPNRLRERSLTFRRYVVRPQVLSQIRRLCHRHNVIGRALQGSATAAPLVRTLE